VPSACGPGCSGGVTGGVPDGGGVFSFTRLPSHYIAATATYRWWWQPACDTNGGTEVRTRPRE
jgi:hypothetical protein